MRLVKTALLHDEQTAAEGINAKYVVENPDLVSDIMGLLKSEGRGLFSRAMRFKLIAKLRKEGLKASEVRKEIDQQYTFLSVLRRFKLFGKFCEIVKSHSLEEATDRLIALIRSVYKKEKESFCLTCAHLNKCQRGLYEVGQHASDGDIDPNCPRQMRQGQQPGTQQMIQGLQATLALFDPATLGMMSAKMPGHLSQFMQGMAHALVGAASQKLHYFNSTFTGSDMMKNMQEIVDKLTTAQLAIFDVARTVDAALKKTKGKKLEKSNEPEKSVAMVKMEHFQDVTKIAPSAAALPSILKNYRLGTKQLQVQQSMKVQGKKQLFYVALDASGSMGQQIMPNRNGFLTRGQVASAMALAVLKKAMEEDGMVFFRFFAGAPDFLHKAKNVHDLIDLARKVGLGDYNGGDTDIQAVLCAAFKDIQKGQGEILKAEVLLISDGQARVDETILKKEQKQTKLHVLEITDAGKSVSSSQTELKGMSETYMEVNPSTVDFKNMAKVI